jgi:DGQHR domain-containing protein
VLDGYQRGAVTGHINDILNYLSSSNPLLPNAIVLALESKISFSPIPGLTKSEWGTFGTLEIPLPKSASEARPAWIVDGQQRATALARLDPKKHFPVVVVGFQTHSRAIEREQFVLVNKTRPLPRDLLHELLPEISAPLSRDLEKRQVAAKVLKILRFNEESPFYGRIRGLGTEEEEGANISQSAILSVIQSSIKGRGVLFNYSDGLKKKHNVEKMATAVNTYFEGARRVWPEAWEGNPKTSRMVHGVGIVALGALMDRVMADVDCASPKAAAMAAHRLAKIKSKCAWTRGRWPILGCAWNELQNTSQDKARLTEYLLKVFAA